MATYLILNLVFLAIVLALLRIKPRWPGKRWLLMLGILLVMTVIFDSLIIAADIVGYDTGKILGVYLGKAPIEDFFYAILAAIIVPVLWRRYDSEKAGKS